VNVTAIFETLGACKVGEAVKAQVPLFGWDQIAVTRRIL
jgi:hypothetical protein